MQLMNIIVVGHKRHGKDTFCELLRTMYGFKFKSSSDEANEHIIYPVLKDKYGYTSLKECFDDRVNHRQEWYELIREYNGDNPSKFIAHIFEENDIYCGLRHIEELNDARSNGLVDMVVWVDASERMEPEDSSSMSITIDDADVVIDNNKDKSHLIKQVNDFVNNMVFTEYVFA